MAVFPHDNGPRPKGQADTRKGSACAPCLRPQDAVPIGYSIYCARCGVATPAGFKHDTLCANCEISRVKTICAQNQDDVLQILGKALGYPWYRDDQETFPGATEENGVFTGEHVAETIAEEAAKKIQELTDSLSRQSLANSVANEEIERIREESDTYQREYIGKCFDHDALKKAMKEVWAHMDDCWSTTEAARNIRNRYPWLEDEVDPKETSRGNTTSGNVLKAQAALDDARVRLGTINYIRQLGYDPYLCESLRRCIEKLRQDIESRDDCRSIVYETRERYQRLQKEFSRAMECLDRVFQVEKGKEPPLLPNFLMWGDDKPQGVIRLAKAYIKMMEAANWLMSVAEPYAREIAAQRYPFLKHEE